MMFEALVINTDTFFEKGTIVVRVPSFYMRTMQWDLSDNYPDFMNDGLKDGEHTYDFEAYVFTPYGGGSNFGTYFLPQVNQRGLVMVMDKYLKKLVWMGGYFEPTRNKDWEVEKVDIPSDDMSQEGERGYGSLNGEQNLLADSLQEAKEKNFVARFKTTDPSTREGLMWEERPTSNIVSIGDNAFFVTHFSKDDGWEDKKPQKWTTYSMHKEDDKEVAKLEVINEKDKKSGKLILNEDGFKVDMDNDGVEYSFNISSEDGEMSIVVNDEHTIKLDKDGKLSFDLGGDINIDSGNDIIIKPDGKVKIGDSNFSALARYNELKKILDKLEKHIHVAPTGPTTGPLESSMSPIGPGIMQDKRNMESEKVEAK